MVNYLKINSRSFKAAIAKGNWLLKLTKYKPGYDKSLQCRKP